MEHRISIVGITFYDEPMTEAQKTARNTVSILEDSFAVFVFGEYCICIYQNTKVEIPECPKSPLLFFCVIAPITLSQILRPWLRAVPALFRKGSQGRSRCETPSKEVWGIFPIKQNEGLSVYRKSLAFCICGHGHIACQNKNSPIIPTNGKLQLGNDFRNRHQSCLSANSNSSVLFHPAMQITAALRCLVSINLFFI